MTRDMLTGSRIRERRVMSGFKQAELAKLSGISPSYLNLIEHNRRKIGGKLLIDISRALGVEPQTLTDGAEAALIASLREAAADAGLAGPELAKSDEFAGRFPGWAEVLAHSWRRIAALEQTVEALTDRLAHDPQLAASLHELLSTATSIRSTAAILAETPTLEPEWRDRFHTNIHADSRRLSASAQGLVSYLETDPRAADVGRSAQAEVEAFLLANGYHFPTLETGPDAQGTVAALIEGAPELQSEGGRFLAHAALDQIATDAAAVSLEAVRDQIGMAGADPAVIAGRLGQPAARIMRRMAMLPELGAGLVLCDRSGTVVFSKSTDGFTVPRFGACCPLWPLFGALGQPGQMLRTRIAQPGGLPAVFDAIATSEVHSAPVYNTPPLLKAVMLLLPARPGEREPQMVGSTCRICPRATCGARREPSILSSGG